MQAMRESLYLAVEGWLRVRLGEALGLAGGPCEWLQRRVRRGRQPGRVQRRGLLDVRMREARGQRLAGGLRS